MIIIIEMILKMRVQLNTRIIIFLFNCTTPEVTRVSNFGNNHHTGSSLWGLTFGERPFQVISLGRTSCPSQWTWKSSSCMYFPLIGRRHFILSHWPLKIWADLHLFPGLEHSRGVTKRGVVMAMDQLFIIQKHQISSSFVIRLYRVWKIWAERTKRRGDGNGTWSSCSL